MKKQGRLYGATLPPVKAPPWLADAIREEAADKEQTIAQTIRNKLINVYADAKNVGHQAQG